MRWPPLEISEHLKAVNYPPELAELDRYFQALGRVPDTVPIGKRFFDYLQQRLRDHGFAVQRGIAYRGARLRRTL